MRSSRIQSAAALIIVLAVFPSGAASAAVDDTDLDTITLDVEISPVPTPQPEPAGVGDDGLATTGGTDAAPLAFAGLALVAAGAGAFAVRRGRRRQPSGR